MSMYDLKFYSEYFFRAANSGYTLNSSPRLAPGCGVSLLSGPRFSKPEALFQELSAPDCSGILFCEGAAETKKIERKAGKGAIKNSKQ